MYTFYAKQKVLSTFNIFIVKNLKVKVYNNKNIFLQ